MLRTTVDPQPTLWESLLPGEFRQLPPGLSAIDRLLDDPVFFELFPPFFDPRRGRPSVPIETYLRLMHLRFRYDLGFETLCAEVTDSLSWRRFCRIGPYDSVPHPTTLMKITTRCGDHAVRQLNEALLERAHAAHLVKLDKLRADTTVVPANVSYPTDSGLLAKGVARLSTSAKALKALGFATRTSFRDRTRSVRRRAHAIGAWLRRRNEETLDELLSLTGELATIAETAIGDARRVATNARRSLDRAGSAASKRACWLVCDLERTCAVLEQVIEQTRTRLAGGVPDGSTRVVSLHDLDARPIRKGRLGKPIEFGYKAQVVDNSDGIVVDLVVAKGNPGDGGLLAPAIRRIIERFGRAPRAVTADRRLGRGGRRGRARRDRRSHRRHPPEGTARRQAPGDRVLKAVPATRQVAHRLGRKDLAPEALVRLRPHDARRSRRRVDVVRLGNARAQQRQDRRSPRRETRCNDTADMS